MRKLNEHPMEIIIKLISYRGKVITEQASLPVLLTALSAEFATFCTDVRFATDPNYGFEVSLSVLDKEIKVPATVDSRKQVGLGTYEYKMTFQFASQDQFMDMFNLSAELDQHLKKDPTYTNFHNMAIWELWMKRQNQMPTLR